MARKSDEIRIRGLRIFAHHGVFEEETRLGQMFVVNATLHTSTRQGGLADALEQTISYADVCVFLTEYLQKNTWKLLEAAVEQAGTFVAAAIRNTEPAHNYGVRFEGCLGMLTGN